ncbi:hypothetical protein PFISCL1PPCAC_16776, partial [Pristionchus fissidentatus]
FGLDRGLSECYDIFSVLSTQNQQSLDGCSVLLHHFAVHNSLGDLGVHVQTTQHLLSLVEYDARGDVSHLHGCLDRLVAQVAPLFKVHPHILESNRNGRTLDEYLISNECLST